MGSSLPLLYLVLLFLAPLASNRAIAEGVPRGFCFLRDVDASIQQDMRYATETNFTGHPLPGYGAGQCVLERSAAEALRQVQQDLAPMHLSLRMLDCYRPKRAVKAMVRWVNDTTTAGDNRYFPRTQKSLLVSQGYIASRSGHSTGGVVDLTLVDLSVAATGDNARAGYGSCTAATGERMSEGGVDMGTTFDCFDPMSATASSEIGAAQRRWRKTLLDVMASHGFSNYAREWWHFSYRERGAPQDFPIPRD